MRRLKLWEILALLGSIAVISAILYPVYATSGPDVNPERVAQAIDRARFASGRWPTRYDEIKPYLNRRSTRYEFAITFLPIETKADSADYVVSVNEDVRRFRTKNRVLTDLKTPVTQGVLPSKHFWWWWS
jgi:hypothetical protein